MYARLRLYARSLLEASLTRWSPSARRAGDRREPGHRTGDRVPRGRLIAAAFRSTSTEPAKAEAGYQKVLSEGLVQDYPLTVRHVSGRHHRRALHAVVYRNEAGQGAGRVRRRRDVTERKRAEAELARYRTIWKSWSATDRRTGALERGTGAIRLRGLARLAGAVARRDGLPGPAGTAARGKARRRRPAPDRGSGPGRGADAHADHRSAGPLARRHPRPDFRSGPISTQSSIRRWRACGPA